MTDPRSRSIHEWAMTWKTMLYPLPTGIETPHQRNTPKVICLQAPRSTALDRCHHTLHFLIQNIQSLTNSSITVQSAAFAVLDRLHEGRLSDTLLILLRICHLHLTNPKDSTMVKGNGRHIYNSIIVWSRKQRHLEKPRQMRRACKQKCFIKPQWTINWGHPCCETTVWTTESLCHRRGRSLTRWWHLMRGSWSPKSIFYSPLGMWLCTENVTPKLWVVFEMHCVGHRQTKDEDHHISHGRRIR